MSKKRIFITTVAIILALLSVVTVVIVAVNTSKNNKDTLYITENFEDTTTYEMPEVMTFSVKALAVAQANGQTVDVKIKATVIPDDASNKAVDFSVE